MNIAKVLFKRTNQYQQQAEILTAPDDVNDLIDLILDYCSEETRISLRSQVEVLREQESVSMDDIVLLNGMIKEDPNVGQSRGVNLQFSGSQDLRWLRWRVL